MVFSSAASEILPDSQEPLTLDQRVLGAKP